MKKALSLILAAAMMAIGFTAMAASASAAATPAAALQIDTVEKWNEFAGKARSYDKKLVEITADLDFTGKEFKPVPDGVCIIDGKGHTMKGITVTVNDAAGGDYGIVANKLSNNSFNGVLQNVKVVDSSITVNVKEGETKNVYVGVVGRLDRGHVSDITIENVSITVNGGKADTEKKTSNVYVGVVAGGKDWATSDSDNSKVGFTAVGQVSKMDNITIKNVTVNAPTAVAGVLLGSMGGDAKASVANLNADVTVTALNEVKNDTLVATAGNDTSFTPGEGNTVTVKAPSGEGDEPAVTTTEAATTTEPATTTTEAAATTTEAAATTAASGKGETTTAAPTTTAPAATTTVAGKGETPTTTNTPNPGNPGGSPATGTAAVVIAAVAAISLAGVVVAAKKRNQD